MVRLRAEELAAINATRVERVDSAIDVLLAILLAIACAMALVHWWSA